MKPAPFDYHCPGELAEAIAILQRYGDEAKVLAGGQSLIPLLSLRLSRFDHLVDLQAIEDLRGVTEVDGSIRVGAMTTQASAARSNDAAAVPLLTKATATSATTRSATGARLAAHWRMRTPPPSIPRRLWRTLISTTVASSSAAPLPRE